VNDRIRAREVLLVSEKGEPLGVKPIEDARQVAQEAGLDLVEVAPSAQPPVCRLIDYGKFRYRQSKRTHESHRHSHVSQLKEVRLKANTGPHDVAVRMEHARKFLERGDRVLVNMLFRGRQLAHTDRGMAVLERFAEDLSDIARVEKRPSMENRRMTMILVQKPSAKTTETGSSQPSESTTV